MQYKSVDNSFVSLKKSGYAALYNIGEYCSLTPIIGAVTSIYWRLKKFIWTSSPIYEITLP